MFFPLSYLLAFVVYKFTLRLFHTVAITAQPLPRFWCTHHLAQPFVHKHKYITKNVSINRGTHTKFVYFIECCKSRCANAARPVPATAIL